MAGEHGVKETKEALLALVMLGKFVATRMKDGVQLDDAMALGTALLADGEFKTKVMAGISGIEMVPAEIKDMQAADLIEMCQVMPELIKILSAE
jgi:hypothetical protein